MNDAAGKAFPCENISCIRFGLLLMAASGLLVSLPTVAATQDKASAAARPYPRGKLLIEPEALQTGRQKLRVLDVRSQGEYEQGHIPGAIRVDHAAWKKAFRDGRDATAWGQRIGGLGIGPQTDVVIYDDALSKNAARIWWILHYWKIKNAALLNGGWRGWQATGRPIEKKTVTAEAVPFEATPRSQVLTRKDALLKQLADPNSAPQIVDARSEGEFCGTDTRTARRVGAMPGAKHLEWSDLLDRKTQRFKPAVELERLFATAGIDLKRPTVTHCQSGGRSSVMAFGLELMGADQVSNYYAGWAEWGNAIDTPVVKPPTK